MRSRTQILIAFFSAMAVTLVAVSDLGRTSPGELSAVHGRVPDLSGRNDCSACHGGMFGTLREACLECHQPIAEQLQASSGLHGTLGARAEQCGLCHAEHHGTAAPLVHGQSFALAGVADAQHFDHARVGFVLDGAHLPLECTKCHANARASILAEGETRFLGLDRNCAACHEDAHQGALTAACASCHGQETWKGLRSIGHERFLPLVGGHGALSCLECHAENSPHALEIVGGSGPRPAARTCVDCHESPHSAPFVTSVARLSKLEPGATCVTCHAPEHTTFHEEGLKAMTVEEHAASGFPLVAPHADLECGQCHSPAEPGFAARYPGRGRDQCVACHEDVHAGQFAEGPFSGRGCLACHDRAHFEPHAFTLEHHKRTALALRGQHLVIACEKCHEKPAEDMPRVFRGTPTDCEGCHADAHDGFFRERVAGEPRPEHGQCELCHDAESFSDEKALGFDHGRFTGFAVAGAHEQSDCAACHPPTEPDATGRSFGRVAEHFGQFTGCVTCHADPHGGRFDVAAGFPAEVEGRSDCARCHVESSFRALPRGFDHDYWTGFALVGAHAASCSACHATLRSVDEHGRTMDAAAGERCADCHEDPHAGQFADEEGLSDCQRCHDDGVEDFLSFDHERDSRFALGEAHSRLACAVCHESELQGGLAVVRYKPLGAECVDCHGTNEEVLLRRKPKRK